MAKVDPYLRPLFDALHDMLDAERVAAAPRARGDRGRAAGLHARSHAQRLVRDPRRGAEHDPRADEDVPHAAGLRLEDGRHRRHHAGRPAARPAVRPDRRRRHPDRRRGHRVRPLRRRGRRAPPARAAHRRGLRRARRAPGARAAARAAAGERQLELDARRGGHRRLASCRGGAAPARGARARLGGRRGRATSRSSSSTRSGSPRSTPSTAATTGPTDVLSFPVDLDGEPRRARASSATS